MKAGRYLHRALALSILLLFAALPNLGAGDKKSNSDKTKQSQATKYVRPTDPTLYVGSETCKTCHEEIYSAFASTPHFATTMDAKLDAHKGPEWHGCEACHGTFLVEISRLCSFMPGLLLAPDWQSKTLG